MRGHECEEEKKALDEEADYARSMLEDMFLDYRWKNIVNTCEHVVYEKVSDETAFVEILFRGGGGGGSVQVSVPLKSGGVQYKTRFSDFVEACRYIEERIDDYEVG